MKTNLVVGLIVSSLGAILNAQSAVSTDPVGFVTVTVPANSDAVLAVPLYRSAAFKGKIQAISGSTLTVAGNPAWAANQFVQALPGQTDTFAVLIATGAKEGLIAKVTANSTHQLTIELPVGENLAGIKTNDADGAGEGDDVDVMPYWTPSTLLPSSLAPGTQMLLIPNGGVNGVGVNLSANPILVFTGSSWLNSSAAFANASHMPLSFASGFILRNNTSAGMNIPMVGAVPMVAHRLPIHTFANNVAQDVWFGYTSPVPENLGSTGLGFSPGDQLLVFDNSSTGMNKSANPILVFTGSSWLNSSSGFANVTNSFMVEPGRAYVFRKAATSTPQTFVWKNTQSYLAP
jgi:uncharacterized protein (TIGR02597 family)